MEEADEKKAQGGVQTEGEETVSTKSNYTPSNPLCAVPSFFFFFFAVLPFTFKGQMSTISGDLRVHMT